MVVAHHNLSILYPQQLTPALQKEKHAPLQAFCFLKWPLGCWHPITAYNSAFIYTAAKCGGFYSSFLRIFKLPRSICWLFCKIPIISWGADLMFWSLEYHVVWHWWPLVNLDKNEPNFSEARFSPPPFMMCNGLDWNNYNATFFTLL